MARETWNGGSGNWSDPTQWTPQQVPRPGDTADLAGGTVRITGVDASNILINDGWNLVAFQHGDSAALDQDATLDITNAVIGDVVLVGGNPVTPHGTAHAVFSIAGGVLFRGTMSIANAGEGATLSVGMASGSILVNQGQWHLDQDGPATVTIAMAPDGLLVNEGGIYVGSPGLGSLTIGSRAADALVNDGTIAAGGTMVIGPSVIGNGTFEIGPPSLGPDSSAEFRNFVGGGETFAFATQSAAFAAQSAADISSASHEVLTLDHARAFLGTIANFAQGDTIDLPGVTATASRYQFGTLTLYDGHAPVAALHFSGTHALGDFVVSDGGGTTVVTHSG